MVRKFSISPEESDLSLPLREEEREVREADIQSSIRPTWSSRTKSLEAYVLVAMSFAITIEHCRTIGMYGSIIFPAYIVCAIVIIVPIVLLEVLMGRYATGNIVKAWSMVPVAKGVLACLTATTAYTIYSNNMYNIYLLKYLFSFYHGHIPWDNCRSPWARENCYVFGDNTTYYMECLNVHPENYCLHLNWETSGMQYWKYVASNHESWEDIGLSATFLAVSIALVVIINLKGIQSCEKAFIVLVYLPFIISFALMFTSYITPGALAGLIQFLNFNLAHISNWRMWLTVLEDFLLAAGLGTLALSFVSSHGRFRDNITADVLVVIFTSILSSLLTATPILSMMSGVFLPKKLSFKKYQDKAFLYVWLSDALLMFPSPNVFWAFLFYLEMIVMTLANQTIMHLAICEALYEIFTEKKKFLYYSIIVGCVSFALATPSLFIMFDFQFPIQTSIITIVILYAITWQIFYGFKKLNDDHHFMLGYPPSLFFLQLFWVCLIPIMTGALAFKMYYRVPDKPYEYVVFIYIAIPLGLYLVVALVQVIRTAKQGNIHSAFKADPNWGPDNPLLKMSRVIFGTRTITKEFMYRQELHRKPLLQPPDFSQQNIVQLT